MGNALSSKRCKAVSKSRGLNRDIILMDGFIRNIDIYYLSQQWIIPQCINNLCLTFFHQIEIFTKYSHYCLYDDISNILQKTNKKRESVYGDISINGYNCGIFKWKIKILNITKAPLYIGIDSNKYMDIYSDFSDPDLNKSTFYAIGQYRNKYSLNIRGSEYGERIWKKNDIITIIIDTRKNQSIFKSFINNKDQKIAFKDLDFSDYKSYRLAISMGDKSCIQIMEFECIPSK